MLDYPTTEEMNLLQALSYAEHELSHCRFAEDAKTRELMDQLDHLRAQLGRNPADWAYYWADRAVERDAPKSGIDKPEIRAAVWDKTGGRCWYCGLLTNPWRTFCIDHVIARARGGSDDLTNLVPC